MGIPELESSHPKGVLALEAEKEDRTLALLLNEYIFLSDCNLREVDIPALTEERLDLSACTD